MLAFFFFSLSLLYSFSIWSLSLYIFLPGPYPSRLVVQPREGTADLKERTVQQFLNDSSWFKQSFIRDDRNAMISDINGGSNSGFMFGVFFFFSGHVVKQEPKKGLYYQVNKVQIFNSSWKEFQVTWKRWGWNTLASLTEKAPSSRGGASDSSRTS